MSLVPNSNFLTTGVLSVAALGMVAATEIQHPVVPLLFGLALLGVLFALVRDVRKDRQESQREASAAAERQARWERAERREAEEKLRVESLAAGNELHLAAALERTRLFLPGHRFSTDAQLLAALEFARR